MSGNSVLVRGSLFCLVIVFSLEVLFFFLSGKGNGSFCFPSCDIHFICTFEGIFMYFLFLGSFDLSLLSFLEGFFFNFLFIYLFIIYFF